MMCVHPARNKTPPKQRFLLWAKVTGFLFQIWWYCFPPFSFFSLFSFASLRISSDFFEPNDGEAEELCFQHRCLHVFILLLSLLFPSPIKDERNKQGFFFFFRKLGKDQALWKRKIWSQRFRKVKKNTNELKKEEYRSRTENKSQHFSNLVKKMCFAVKHMPFPKMTANHVCLGILWLAFLGKEQKSQGSTPGIPLREVGGKPKSLSGNNWSSSLFRKGGLMHFSLKCKMKNKILKMKNKFIF